MDYKNFAGGTTCYTRAHWTTSCKRRVGDARVHVQFIMPWKLRRSKSVEALSNQRIRITAADEKCKSDEKCKKTSKMFGTLTRKSGEKFAPVVPPRPTEKAIANAKRSPTRKRYVELDLSGGDTDGQSAPQLIPQTDPGAAEYVGQRSRSLPTKVAQTSTARSTRTASVSAGLENGVSSSRLIQRSPSVKASLSSSTYACAGSIQSACTLPRSSPTGRRASAPTTPAAINSKRDRKVTGINAKESVYKPRTSSLNGTANPGSPCSSRKSETLPPKHLQFRSFRHPSPGSPCSSRKSEPALTTRDLQLRYPSPSGSPCSSRKSEFMTREVYISHSPLESPRSSRKSEYIKPKDLYLRHPSPASPCSSRKSEPALTTRDHQPRHTSPASSPASATPTPSSPSSAKRSEAPKRPEPPKIERAPVPLPRTKKRNGQYSATVLSLTSRQEEVKAEENDYEYIHFEPRHVVVPNAYLDTESKAGKSCTSNSRQQLLFCLCCLELFNHSFEKDTTRRLTRV